MYGPRFFIQKMEVSIMYGWIKLYRELMEWEWYHDSCMVHLFIHLLLSANAEDKKWKGHLIKKGQLVTSLRSLKKETGITISKLRTCLSKLEKTGEIERSADTQKTFITISNFGFYQQKEEKLTHDRHTIDTRKPNFDTRLTHVKEDEQRNREDEGSEVDTRPKKNSQILTTNKNKEKNKEKRKEGEKFPYNFSDPIVKIYEFALKYFPTEYQPNTDKQKYDWLDTIDKLVRIDGHDKREISMVIKWARLDDFWSVNFRSIKKLRQKDKQDTKYYYVFRDQMNKKSKKNGQKSGQIINDGRKPDW